MAITSVSPQVLDALKHCAGEPDRHVIEGIRRLSTLFTIGREGLGQEYFSDQTLRRAYLLYFAPVNLVKVIAVLDEVGPLPVRPLRILDLGSGPGIGALAVWDYVNRSDGGDYRGTEVLSVDCNRQVLREAEALWNRLPHDSDRPHPVKLKTVCVDLGRHGEHMPWMDTQYDVVLVCNSINELFRSAKDPIGRRVQLIVQLLERLNPDGCLIVIEPALRETSRALHEIRDRVVALGAANIFSPCLHEHPCPALVNPHDWCHEERPWLPPEIIRELDRAVGFIKDALKFSYVVLRKDGATITARSPDVYRVVSERLIMKGEQRVWLCNETGRSLVGRLNKARSDTNATFDTWHRGAIVRVDQIERKGAVGRIGKDVTTEVVCPIEDQ